VIDGLEESAACPECGRAVSDSLPEARTGVAWQHGAGPRGWIRGLLEAAFKPRASFRVMSIADRRASRMHLRATLWLAAALPALVVASGATAARSGGPSHETSAIFVLVLAAASGLGYAVLQGLTAIERRGIRLWGRVHRRRITAEVAWAVCSHASLGWVGAGALVAAGLVLGPEITRWGFVRDVGWLRPYVNIAGYLLPLVGFGIGMIWFEILVYVGAVSCRFANPPRANTPKRDA